MIGCALALFYDRLQFKCNWLAPAALFLFVVSPYLITRLHGYYLLPLGFTLDNLAIAYLLLYAVPNPGNVFGRVLNHRVIAHVGVVSYLIVASLVGKSQLAELIFPSIIKHCIYCNSQASQCNRAALCHTPQALAESQYTKSNP